MFTRVGLSGLWQTWFLHPTLDDFLEYPWCEDYSDWQGVLHAVSMAVSVVAAVASGRATATT